MRLETFMKVTVTFDNQRRKKCPIELDKIEGLKDAIERVISSQKEEYYKRDCVLYHIIPEYPLIDSAMKDPKLASLLKVRIAVFSQRYSLGARAD